MKKKVSTEQWLAVLAVFAEDAGVSVKQALERTKNRKSAAVRRAAFQHFLGRGYGVYSLARVSGFSVSLVKVAGRQEWYDARCRFTRERYHTKKAEKASGQCVAQRLAA